MIKIFGTLSLALLVCGILGGCCNKQCGGCSEGRCAVTLPAHLDLETPSEANPSEK